MLPHEFDHHCIGCDDILTDENWSTAKQNKGTRRYICNTCENRNRGVSRRNRNLYYDSLFEKQRGCCDMCGIHSSLTTRGLFLDHNHDTDETRGLLCSRCNSQIGAMENKKLIELGNAYLEKYEGYSTHDPNGQQRIELGTYVWVNKEFNH